MLPDLQEAIMLGQASFRGSYISVELIGVDPPDRLAVYTGDDYYKLDYSELAGGCRTLAEML